MRQGAAGAADPAVAARASDVTAANASLPSDFMYSPLDRSRLLRLHIGGADHLAPLLGLGGDELAELGGRAGQHRAAQFGQPRLQFRIGKTGVDLLVELVDDIGRRLL